MHFDSCNTPRQTSFCFGIHTRHSPCLSPLLQCPWRALRWLNDGIRFTVFGRRRYRHCCPSAGVSTPLGRTNSTSPRSPPARGQPIGTDFSEDVHANGSRTNSTSGGTALSSLSMTPILGSGIVSRRMCDFQDDRKSSSQIRSFTVAEGNNWTRRNLEQNNHLMTHGLTFVIPNDATTEQHCRIIAQRIAYLSSNKRSDSSACQSTERPVTLPTPSPTIVVTSSADDRQRVTSAADERQRVSSSAEDRQRVTSAANDRQRVTSPIDRQCVTSPVDRQRVTSAADDRQRVTSSAADDRQRVTSPDDRQRVTSPADDRQRVTSAADDRQRVTSPVDRQRVTSAAEDKQCVMSPVNRQRVTSAANDKQRATSPDDRQCVTSPIGRQRVVSPVDKQRVTSPGDTHRMTSAADDRQRVTSTDDRQRVTSPIYRQRVVSPVDRQRVTSPGDTHRVTSAADDRQRVTSPVDRQHVTSPVDRKRVTSPVERGDDVCSEVSKVVLEPSGVVRFSKCVVGDSFDSGMDGWM